jgi:hypothetical protein
MPKALKTPQPDRCFAFAKFCGFDGYIPRLNEPFKVKPIV